MKHLMCRVTSFKQIDTYILRVTFDDGAVQVIDFEPVLRGEMFGPLRDPALFARVRLDPEVHTLVWPNDADFDPADLHDWPQCAEEFAERAREWESARVSSP